MEDDHFLNETEGGQEAMKSAKKMNTNGEKKTAVSKPGQTCHPVKKNSMFTNRNESDRKFIESTADYVVNMIPDNSILDYRIDQCNLLKKYCPLSQNKESVSLNENHGGKFDVKVVHS